MKVNVRNPALSRLGLVAAMLITTPAWAATTVYAMPNCDCCDSYVKYLQQNGIDASEKVTSHLSALAKQDGVPVVYREQTMGMDTGICHLTKIDGYAVVGHVPVQVIRRLLREKPRDIRGVILPGMPVGSPGMDGKKMGPIVIYAFDAHGKSWVYAKI